MGAQLEHRKAVAAKDEEEKRLREQRKQREEERRLQQERLQKQREDEKKRKDEEEEDRLKWEGLRLLQEKESKEKLEQQKKEENAKKLLQTQQILQKKDARDKITLWGEPKKLQVEESTSAFPQPFQPALSSFTVSPFTSESPSLQPKKKPAPPKPPLPYNKKHPPAITVTTQSSPKTQHTDSWETNFKGITTVTSSQVAAVTTSHYSNITMTTAAAVTSLTKPKANDVAEDPVTVSIDDRYFSSVPDDVLTQSTRVFAEVELV